LEIEKAKTVADQRLEAYRSLKQTNLLLQSKFENFEREFGVVSKNLSGNPSVINEFSRLFLNLDEVRKVLQTDIRTQHVEEPTFILGEIHGSEEGFLRLQSAFRTLE